MLYFSSSIWWKASSRLALLPVITTLQPFWANKSAMALPNPEVEPVIKAHLPRIMFMWTNVSERIWNELVENGNDNLSENKFAMYEDFK